MKQLTTIFYITFLLGILNLQGQNYIPMAVDSAVWLIGRNQNPMTGEFASYAMEFTNGDTIVNNVHYYKVYGQDSHSGQILRDSFRLKMLIRDEISTHAVYGIIIPDDISSCPNLVDIRLFDFNPFLFPSQGLATAANCLGNNEVFYIDTINIYGMDRRRFTMHFGNWIEGIGGDTQGLNPLNGGSSVLVDYCRGTPGDCGAYAWVKTKDIRTYQNGKLYPNPAHHQARLELEEYINHGRVLIYNLLGQLQSEQYFEGQEAVLDVRNYEKGIYMVQVFDKEKLVFGEKLVVN
jgi:hypothetical protein